MKKEDNFIAQRYDTSGKENYFGDFYHRKQQQISIIINLNSMNILGKLKHMLKASDFFYSTEMLRYDQEMQYRTLTGGIISLGIIVTICIGFASMIIDTLNLQSISTTKQIIKNLDPSYTSFKADDQSKFMFGVQILGVDLTDSSRYFDINFIESYETSGNVYHYKEIPLERCTKEHWRNHQNVLDRFDTLSTQEWLCPPIGTSINLFGKFSSSNFSYYSITASACKNETDPSRPCKPLQEIQQFFSQNQDFIYYQFFFGNVVINPDQKQYKKYYLQDKVFSIFGSTIGTQIQLQFSDYQIETDYSIWPFTSIEKDLGAIVESLPVRYPYQTNINGTYASFYFTKSSDSYVYIREVQKISSVFSFMGGMIGAISAVLFIIKVYNNFSFELSIALQLFNRDGEENSQTKKDTDNEDGSDQIKSQYMPQGKGVKAQMNLCQFFQYHFYTILRSIGKDLEWPKMRYLKACEKQILKQLDVKALLKRVIFIEYCLTVLFQDYQLNGLQENIPKTLSEIKAIRQKCTNVIDANDHSDIPIQAKSQRQQNSIHRQSHLELPSLHSPQFCELKTNMKLKSTILAPDILVVDMQTEKDVKTKNGIIDNYALQIKRQSFRQELKADFQNGNPISVKIFGNLNQKKKTKKMSFLKVSNF